jgi:hypothetical protein
MSETRCLALVFSDFSYLLTDITEVEFSIRRYRARFCHDMSFSVNYLMMLVLHYRQLPGLNSKQSLLC